MSGPLAGNRSHTFNSSIVTPRIEIPFAISFFNDPATPDIYTLSLHDALPIWRSGPGHRPERLERRRDGLEAVRALARSEEHTSELQSLRHLVCRLLLEKKNSSNSKNRQYTKNDKT